MLFLFYGWHLKVMQQPVPVIRLRLNPDLLAPKPPPAPEAPNYQLYRLRLDVYSHLSSESSGCISQMPKRPRCSLSDGGQSGPVVEIRGTSPFTAAWVGVGLELNRRHDLPRMSDGQTEAPAPRPC